MGLTLDVSGIGNPDDMQSGGVGAKPGHGMGLITKWSEYTGPASSHELEIEIVAWTNTESVGVVHEEKVWTKDNSGKGHPAKVLTAIGVAGGLFMPADIADWQSKGVMPEIDYSQLVNRPVMLQIILEPDKDDKAKFWPKIASFGKGIYHIKDPRVKDWPVHQGIFTSKAALVGEYRAAGTKPTTPPAAEADPFANA